MEKARIMIVEDEKLVALSIEKCLKTMGYEVPLTVSTGEEAVQKVLELEPDLVLMDIRLKGAIDGVEAANRIKTRYKIPIVYLTAYSEDSTLERAKITEPFGYLTKPFEERTLQATVEMALYRATMQGKLRRNKEKLETILQCIAEGVVVTSVNGTIEYLNPAAQKLLLRDETLSQGVFLQQVFRAVDAYTRKPVVLPVSKILMEGENVQLADLLLHTREQGRLPIDCSLAPLRDENGSIRGMVLAFRSVAERWKMQEIVGREVRQAIELQRSLLPPQGTSLPRLQMRWFFFPAALAAGDLFNLFPIDPTHVGIYMVDAPGHGIASAVNSLLLHQFLSIVPGQGTYLKLLDADALDPVQVAQKLAARLSSGGDLQSFSLVYGIIETETGVATMVRTGLPVPLVLRAKGPVETAPAWAPEQREEFPSPFTGYRLQMDAGDRLFLYSDGLLECANPDLEPFSQERLAAQIEKVRGARLGDAVAALEDQVRKWRSRADFDDDVCLMALQFG